MRPDNFLTNLYAGEFKKGMFEDFYDIQSDSATDEVLSAFKEVSKDYPPKQLEAQGPLTQEILDQLKRTRFFGLSIPADYDGVGLRIQQYLKVVEEIASQNLVLGFTAMAHLSIGVKGIVLYGTEQQKKKYLPAAARGDLIFSYALTEPKTGSDAQHIQTTATLSDDGKTYILNGQKTYITNAGFAGAMTVFAQLDPKKPGYMGAFIIETAWDGVHIGKEMPKMGLKASSTAAVHFKDVRVPVENMLGTPGDGFKIAMTILYYGRLALGAASVGMMNRSLVDMQKRGNNRKQFGIPINNFELVQEKMVKAKVNSYMVSAITAFTAGQLEKNPLATAAVESSHCKLFGTTRAWETLYDAMQVSGGAGYLATQPYEQRMRDFRVATIFEGTTEIHSMYPALFLLRSLQKEMDEEAPGKIDKLKFLIKRMFVKNHWPQTFKHKKMQKMIRVAKIFTKKIQFWMTAGLLLYGKGIIGRQFFLRKISFLSLYLYGILSALARMNNALTEGNDIEEDIVLVAAFMEEAKQFQRETGFFALRRKERINKTIVDLYLNDIK